MCVGVHLLSILLVFDYDGDIVGQGEEIGVQKEEDATRRVQETMHRMQMHLVHPILAVLVYSHDCMAKKDVPRTKSAMCAWAVVPVLCVLQASSLKYF